MKVDSSQIQDINYEPKGGILAVTFHYQKRVYVYGGIPPETWKQFVNTSSKGKFFHSIIKPNFKHMRVS